MSNGGNNADNVPAGNNSDNSASTVSHSYSDGSRNALKKFLEIESIADTPICAVAAIQTIDFCKREDGSVSLLRKIKSLQGRWSAKTKEVE